MSKAYYTLQVELDYTRYHDGATVREKVVALSERDRRQKAVHGYLSASGHKYMKRSNAFATQDDAERAVLLMGFPYKINVSKVEWI